MNKHELTQTVLVTGAAGFLGRAVCRMLVDNGIYVKASYFRGKPFQQEGISWFQADWRQEGCLNDVGHFDAVLHLAAVLPKDMFASVEAADDNREIDANVFRL